MPPRAALKLRRKGAAVDPLHRVKQLGAKVLRDGDKVEVSLMEVGNAADEVDNYIRKADDENGQMAGLWTAVGDDGVLGLQALYALVLRRSCCKLTPEVSDTHRAAYAALRGKLSTELCNIIHDEGGHMSVDRVRVVAWAALRPHTLRCLAGLLANASAQLSLQLQRPSRRICQAARDALDEGQRVTNLVHDLLTTKNRDAALLVDDRQLARGFVKELDPSRFLEHWSRLLLQLSACEGWAEEAAQQLSCMARVLPTLHMHLTFLSGPWQHWLHALLVSSPCLSYLLSSHVVGLCAWLDGGPTYGMPAAVDGDDDGARVTAAAASAAGAAPPPPHAAPVYCTKGLLLRREAPEGACTALAEFALWMWLETLHRQRALDAAPTAIAPAAAALNTTAGAAAGGGSSPQATVTDADAGPAPAAAAAASASVGASASTQPACTSEADGPAAPTVAGQPPAPPPLPPVQPRLCMRRLGLGRTPLSATPPLNTAATLELCLRLAAAATKAVKAGGAAEGATAARRMRPLPSRGARLAAAGANTVAALALACGREAIGREVLEAEALAPATEARLRRWWSALVAFMDVVAGLGTGATDAARRWYFISAERTSVIEPKNLAAPSGLPESPTPCVAAALAAGFVSSLDRLLRVLEPGGPLPCSTFMSTSHAWGQILAFGEPGETAPLVSTIARLLRSAADDLTPETRYPLDSLLGVADSMCAELPWHLFHGANGEAGRLLRQPQEQQAGVAGAAQTEGAPAELQPLVGTQKEEEAGTEKKLGGGETEGMVAGRMHGTAVPNRVDDNAAGLSAAAPPAVPSAAPDACSTPGRRRLGLLVSYIIVHVMPTVRHALLRVYLPATDVKTSACAVRLLTHLTTACGLLAVAHDQEVEAAAAATGTATTSATVGAPSTVQPVPAAGCSGQDPSSAASPQPPPVSAPAQPAAATVPAGEWRRVLIEELCLPEVLGAALGLLHGWNVREATYGYGMAKESDVQGMKAALMWALVRMLSSSPLMLVEALTSDVAETMAMIAAGPRATALAVLRNAQADAAEAAAESSDGPGQPSSSSGLPQRRTPLWCALESLFSVNPAGSNAAAGEHVVLTALRHLCAHAGRPAEIRTIAAALCGGVREECDVQAAAGVALLVPPSRLLQLLPVDLSTG